MQWYVSYILATARIIRSPMTRELHVSLEPHLVETLRPLIGSTPSHLSVELSKLLPNESSAASQSTVSPMISYALLQSISKWARTEEGEMALQLKDPPLDPLAYSMVSLLAGTRTSPDKKFPALPRVPTRSEDAAREISDRRAIVAVLNAILSVICTGAAVWWAAQHTGWRDEWVRNTCSLAQPATVLTTLNFFSESTSVATCCNHRCRFRGWTLHHMGYPAREAEALYTLKRTVV